MSRNLYITDAEDISSIDQSIARLCLESRIEFNAGLQFTDNKVNYKEIIRGGKI